MAVFLMLVARPFAVATGLWPFRFRPREVAYISWVGLRGAVPIVLAIVPVMMGVPDSLLLFDVAFAVVLLSLLVQGATVPGAARVLGVEVPPRDEPVDRQEVWVGNCGRRRSHRCPKLPDDVGNCYGGLLITKLPVAGTMHRPSTRSLQLLGNF
jgi:hypothetical protein